MAQRTVALCDGQYIGIESICTIINGEQIYIPEKLEEIRAKSRQEKLLCPCGCRKILTLVAGDKMLREQHFREKHGTGNYNCTMPVEGKTSIDSKIVLKCWLDDKLHSADIESRVPISSIEDTKRRAEFTFLSMANKLAIRYWRLRSNIITDRLDVLTGNFTGIKVIYIVDISNSGTNGQYPEALMKIQKEQGYCLFLSIDGFQYDKGILSAAFYDKDLEGYWKEVKFADAPLKSYYLDNDCNICLNGETLENICCQAKKDFLTTEEKKKQAQIEYEKQQEEMRCRIQEEENRRIKEAQIRREEQERLLQLQREAAEKHRQELEEQKRLAAEAKLAERQKQVETFHRNLTLDFSTFQEKIIDPDGNRWLQCEFCGMKSTEKDFVSWKFNVGTCRTCSANRPAVKIVNSNNSAIPKWDPYKCPICGGKLLKRIGSRGPFLGCQNFPNCRHTSAIPK